MKKTLIFFGLMTATLLAMNSCTPEEKECEKNNTGELSLINTKNHACVVDLRGQSGSFLIVPVQAGSTLKIPMAIPVGTVTIWVQQSTAAEYFQVGTQAISQCSESTFSISFNDCEYEEKGTLTVTNPFNITLNVDVRYGNSALENSPFQLDYQGSQQITLNAGEVSIWIKTTTSEWEKIGNKTIVKCTDEPFEIAAEDCFLYDQGTLNVSNTSNILLDVDVRAGNSTTPNNPFQLAYQQSQQLILDEGLVSIWVKAGASDWQKVAEKNIVKCTVDDYSVVAPDCFLNNTGEIVLTNANPFPIQVDVINSETGILNEIRALEPNASTIYTLKAGLEATIQVKPTGGSWTNVAYRTPVQCGSEPYSWDYCNYGGNSYAKLVTVFNNTGSKSVVDVLMDGSAWAGEITLENGETAYYYNVRAGNIRFWHRYYGQSNWTYSNDYYVAVCGTFNFTWNNFALKNGIASKEAKQTTEYKPFESLGVSNIVK